MTRPALAGNGGARAGRTPAARRLVLAIAALAALAGPPASAQDAKRGEYLAAIGGCRACHTAKGEGATPYAGGRALKTPFGTFYGPNITPDPANGIGRWSEADFRRALREGVRPDGASYFPAFPYVAFTGITDQDARDLYAYFRSLPPAATANKPHELRFPFGIRMLVAGWKLLYFVEGPLRPDRARSAAQNRGAYLAEALAHCGECHTPRDFLGGLKRELWLAGTRDGPEGGKVPNITPDPATGIGKWSEGELRELLAAGMTPDGDFVGAEMAEVVSHGTGKLTPDDMAAMLVYLRAIRPVVNDLRGPAR